MTTVTVLDNTPTTPTNLQNTTGVFWINWTWNVSAGNIDDYDIQINGSSVGVYITNLYYYSTYSAT
jgi:hypothetical protein